MKFEQPRQPLTAVRQNQLSAEAISEVRSERIERVQIKRALEHS
jgi:hypothetical protein